MTQLPPVRKGHWQLPNTPIQTQLSHEERVRLLETEMQLLQSRFDKYDDLMFRTRAWLMAAFGGLVGAAVTVSSPELAIVAVIAPVAFFLNEVAWRWFYWYKFVLRYKFIRDALNHNCPVEYISVYDLTHKYNRVAPNDWSYLLARAKDCVLKPEAVLFYGLLTIVALFVKSII